MSNHLWAIVIFRLSISWDGFYNPMSLKHVLFIRHSRNAIGRWPLPNRSGLSSLIGFQSLGVDFTSPGRSNTSSSSGTPGCFSLGRLCHTISGLSSSFGFPSLGMNFTSLVSQTRPLHQALQECLGRGVSAKTNQVCLHLWELGLNVIVQNGTRCSREYSDRFDVTSSSAQPGPKTSKKEGLEIIMRFEKNLCLIEEKYTMSFLHRT